MSQPLDGIRVLDLTRLLPGGVLTMMLADMGADVIKVESPNGGDYARWMGPMVDGSSVYFRMNNRGKRSIILNLKETWGQEVLQVLAAEADVLVESFRPGVMARLGCDYDALRAVNAELVYCSLSGWGADGPYAGLASHDLNYASVAGLVGTMETPQPIGGQVADIGGAYAALSGILGALFRRERGGGGAYVDTSLSESALPFALYNWVEGRTLGTANGQGDLTGGLACYRVYMASDGEPVALAALEEKFWRNFCEAVERPDLIPYHQVPESQAYLRETLSTLFAQKPSAEWEALLGDAECCFSRVRRAGEIDGDPHYQAREMLGTFEDGTPWMRSPVRLSDGDADIRNDVPGYGEHTQAVLTEAGYDMETIRALEQAGITR